jgi:hypothetical protein
MSSPGGSSAIHEGYTCRPIEIPPVEQWKPDVDFHDSNKVNGLDFPSRIRQSRFSSYKDIEGMDPLQVPLWKFLYQGLHNTWLRRVAYGRETFVLPFDNIGTTVFVAELVSQLRTRNVDLDNLERQIDQMIWPIARLAQIAVKSQMSVKGRENHHAAKMH